MPDQVATLRDRFGLQRLVLVGGHGMLTHTRIEILRGYPAVGWISALRHRDVRQPAEEGGVQMSLADQRNPAEIDSPHYPGERLVVCCNPALAEHRRRKRAALLPATEEALERIQRELRRRTKKLPTATEIAEKMGRARRRL